jgi:hypothetical protein
MLLVSTHACYFICLVRCLSLPFNFFVMFVRVSSWLTHLVMGTIALSSDISLFCNVENPHLMLLDLFPRFTLSLERYLWSIS